MKAKYGKCSKCGKETDAKHGGKFLCTLCLLTAIRISILKSPKGPKGKKLR